MGGLLSVCEVCGTTAFAAARSIAESFIEQIAWYIQQSEPPLVGRQKWIIRLGDDLHRLLSEKDLDDDLGALKLDLVPSAVRATNDCMCHGLASLNVS